MLGFLWAVSMGYSPMNFSFVPSDIRKFLLEGISSGNSSIQKKQLGIIRHTTSVMPPSALATFIIKKVRNVAKC